MEEFCEKVVLVTGGTSGMGHVIARRFCELGANVIVTGRDRNKGISTIEEFQDIGKVDFFQTDHSDYLQVKELFLYIKKKYSKLEYAVNNAGITSKHEPLSDVNELDWTNLIATNLNSVFFCMKYEIALMLEGKFGVIVNNSSVAGLIPMPKQAAYCASKSAVIALSKSAALDYAQDNIRINVVLPGPIEGGMNNEINLRKNPERTRKKLELTAMHRFGKPDEVADAIIWLCSNKSSFVTGSQITVDGGFHTGKW